MADKLSQRVKITRVANAAAAGQTAVNSSGVDMAGFDGVLFAVMFGAITAGGAQSVKAQQSSDDGSSDTYADLLGTSAAVADSDDNKIVYLDISRTTERYVRVVVSRATQDSVVDGIVAIQYGARKVPVTHAASVIAASERHSDIGEGTA